MSIPHDSAQGHVRGKSEYIDDRSMLKNELYADVLYSHRAHAKILNIDFSKALKNKNIIAVFTGKDFHYNFWGAIFQDQPILATDICQYAGEPIAIIVGKNLSDVQYSKKLIQITYEDIPSILSIEEAIEANSFIGEKRIIQRGNFNDSYQSAEHKIEGTLEIQGAEHFYLENQSSIVYPLEDGQLEIHTSSQHPTETQHTVAHALGIDQKDVVCIVKRMGGGFGGKESQSAPFAAMSALCAKKLNVPVRLCLTKDDDMIITGKRNPFKINYKVGFNQKGTINALKVDLFSDAGAYADLSTAIMERAMLHCDNAYFIQNMLVAGQVCKTNHHSNTAFRGFGGPKGVSTIERIIEEISHYLKIDPLEVRKLNLYTPVKNITHYGQEVKNNKLEELFKKAQESFEYDLKRKQIEQFNLSNGRYLKGLSLTAVKFGISFTTRFLNQANASIIIHQDGTVQVATGATEMGQGVNTRIGQLIASELGISTSQIRLMPTRTDKNANTSPTAASSGTDLNGAAALLAVRKIKYRLSQLALKVFEIPEEKWAKNTSGLGSQPEVEVSEIDHLNDPNAGADWKSGVAQYFNVDFRENRVLYQKKSIHFSDLILEAYLNRISLSDYAHYKIPGIEFNKLTGQGNAFLYFTQGVALSEVIIDKDSGELKVSSSQILMDLGRPINESLDKGQISGAFIQGMGWVTSENLVYNDQGFLLTHAPSTYKIPNIQDIPRHYTIELLENDENYMNVRGTKAVGEPPLLLAISVWTAAQNALTYLDHYKNKYPLLDIPATNERILRAIHPDEFLKWDKKNVSKSN
ncbi:MAG: molybdopterin-dependent oxidoreductase [Halobacteriovoraceae bacterium]|nr:molybdopterin-dependent oxidoreductase [Halobacteriovoraceae bacterium]